MGQKINPVGFRLGIFRKWKYTWFLEKKKYTDFLHLNFEIMRYFKGVFRNNNTRSLIVDCITSKISFSKIYIFILFYRLRRKKKKFKKKKSIRFKQEETEELKALPTPICSRERPILNNILLSYIRKNREADSLTLNTFLNYYRKKSKKVRKLHQKTFNLTRKKKIMIRRKFIRIHTIKESLKTLTQSNICLILINSIAFIKFYEKYYKIPKKRNDFVSLERKMVKRYRSEVRLAKDTLYVLFIALILKKTEFLAKFLGYQLKRMPKNRRQTKLIYYLRNLMRYALTVQEDIIGFRIQFTGRINGRPRSKITTLNEGILPLQTQSAGIEYGESFGITRYGTIGVKIWINYDCTYNSLLKDCFYKYFEYGLLKKNVAA